MSNPGLGVMLQMLRNNNDTAIAVQHAIGRKIREAGIWKPGEHEAGTDTLTLRFEDGSLVRLRDAGQSCCESRYMTCDDDLASFAGATVVSIEDREVPAVVGEYGDSHEIAFLVITTDLGAITVATHNEHNGYYGGFALEAEIA